MTNIVSTMVQHLHYDYYFVHSYPSTARYFFSQSGIPIMPEIPKLRAMKLIKRMFRKRTLQKEWWHDIDTDTNRDDDNSDEATSSIRRPIQIFVTPPTPTDHVRLEDLLVEQAGEVTILRAPKPPLEGRDSSHSMCAPGQVGYLEVPPRPSIQAVEKTWPLQGHAGVPVK